MSRYDDRYDRHYEAQEAVEAALKGVKLEEAEQEYLFAKKLLYRELGLHTIKSRGQNSVPLKDAIERLVKAAYVLEEFK